MMTNLYHPPDLELAREKDPRLIDPRLSPEALDLVSEEMMELGLDPNKIERDQYLKARYLWMNGEQPRSLAWLKATAEKFQAQENEHARAIGIFLSENSWL